MTRFLNRDHFPAGAAAAGPLGDALDVILARDGRSGTLPMLAGYKQILADNRRKDEWGAINEKLMTLFKCGTAMPLDGPMIGISISIRDSDYFAPVAEGLGKGRSALARLEWMASLWNLTFGKSGIWMGKTFEPVPRDTVAQKCANHPATMAAFDPATTRIGRNFFRQPHNPSRLQLAGLPVLTRLWNLKDRPLSVEAGQFDSILLAENLEKEKAIPYTRTGGIFLAQPGHSVVDAMNAKPVYQLNYRWPKLHPVYPMTRLVDELVQIDDGVYLGQLVMATRRYSLGAIDLLPGLIPGADALTLGEAYDASATPDDYGYQNNGFFLMIDTKKARQAYADDAFSFLRPHPGEVGYADLEYDQPPLPQGARSGSVGGRIEDWRTGWPADAALKQKFTTFCLEASPRPDDGDVRELLNPGESILQMLQRIQGEIGAQTRYEDHLAHFEKLNRLFRSGVAPTVKNGCFHGNLGQGFNVRHSGLPDREWYGVREPLEAFDYYHGATLNLHWGFGDTLRAAWARPVDDPDLFPSALAEALHHAGHAPNLLDQVWAGIGRFIFPWAGKSFERVSGRKLSMLLDESDDLAARYPERVRELKTHAASWPHYDLVKKNAGHYWDRPGLYADRLRQGSWDNGMPEVDKAFWRRLASDTYVFGNNIQDSRITAADAVMHMLDMNYRIPEKPLLELAEAGPSPFVRMGYIFLGAANQTSILPMNNGPGKTKTVFQFHYRFPMIGGAAPIGTCLDEIVQLADGLFLGQLIYATRLTEPFHSSTSPEAYAYQLFGYFLLLDNDWEYHRQAIGLDVIG